MLTKLRNNFTEATVPFTRHELLTSMGWPNRGQYYRRLHDSLHRWMGVTLYYDKSWWDNALKCRVDASFHILDSVVILDHRWRDEERLLVRARSAPDPGDYEPLPRSFGR